MPKRIVDHADRMRSFPEEYGFVGEELSALTREEMKKGVTKEKMLELGERIYNRALVVSRVRRKFKKHRLNVASTTPAGKKRPIRGQRNANILLFPPTVSPLSGDRGE